ncbi:MAG: sulfotransferase [Gammaproteobacteria bacterium]|nr:sulfotransferase [Gammaproteobacteria bacterium]
MKKLDFIIIGAQKSATTSLYKYLKPHPKIFMSSAKEAPFFSKDELYYAGWDNFVDEYFEGAPHDLFWGTASPQYMGNHLTPARIHKMMPDVRLIALLRNPIDRSYSHYTMSVRRGNDGRDFDAAVEALLKPEALQGARMTMPVTKPDNTDEDESGHYLVWSEYGRILGEFLKYFPKEQLKVVYMDDLTAEPEEVYRQIINFIGIADNDHIPANIGKVYHKGGTQRIIPERWREALKSNSIFRFVWDRLPENLRIRIRYLYEQKNIKKASTQEGPSQQAKNKLILHFAEDVKQLEKITGNKVPWPEFHSQVLAESKQSQQAANEKYTELKVLQ